MCTYIYIQYSVIINCKLTIATDNHSRCTMYMFHLELLHYIQCTFSCNIIMIVFSSSMCVCVCVCVLHIIDIIDDRAN